MNVLIGTAIAAALGLLVYMFVQRKSSKKLAGLREMWGRRPDRENDIETARAYFKLHEAHGSGCYRLDDGTWNDLDMDAVFALADRTASPTGAQCLYDLLRHPLTDREALEERDRLIEAFRTKRSLREGLQLALRNLEGGGADVLPDALWSPLPDKPRYAMLFPVLGVLPILIIALWFLGLVNLLVVVPFLIVNIVVHMLLQRTCDINFFESFQHLGTLIGAAAKISRMEHPELKDMRDRLERDLGPAQKISRLLFLLAYRDPNGLTDYLNLFLLMDLTSFFSAVDKIRANIGALRRLYENVGYLDAIMAVASLRAGRENYCSPVFLETVDWEVQDGINPLLTEPIPNSIVFSPQNVLITGSNMAGKTTFLKTIGVNAILAQTLVMAFAARYRSPIVRVKSSIGRTDDLLQGKSYYMAEVEAIKGLIEASDTGTVHLFILDEIYRGTNSVERQAASVEVLKYLANRKDFVLVATHDLALTQLLAKTYANYHFQEEILDDGLSFDYTLHPGPSTSRNAIALLKYVGYPESIVENALERIAEDKNGALPSAAGK